MILKYISDIHYKCFPYIDLFVAMTSLNKHEHCTFQNPNPAPVKGSLKGTDRLEKRFDGIIIISDEVAFMSAALLCVQPLAGKALFRLLLQRLLLAEDQLAFSISWGDHILITENQDTRPGNEILK